MTKAAAARKIQKAYELAISERKLDNKAAARAAELRVNDLCKSYNLKNPFKKTKPKAIKAVVKKRPRAGQVKTGNPFFDVFMSELQLLMNEAADVLESAGIKLIINS